MGTDRRDFLRLAAVAGGAASLGITPRTPAAASTVSLTPPSKRAIRILILGGTGFIGPYQVRYALERGHTVTLFNRGRTNTHLFPGVERLVGDRNGQLAALAVLGGAAHLLRIREFAEGVALVTRRLGRPSP